MARTLTPIGEAMAEAVEQQEVAEVREQHEVGAVWAAQIAEEDAPAGDEPSPDPNANDVDFGEGAPDAPTVDDDLDDEYDDEPVERSSGYVDPREDLLSVLRRRLEGVLQPVDDDDAWHGVFVITRKNLGDVLQLPLPSPSRAAAVISASAWMPGTVYVEATCPRCRQAVDAVITIRPQLLVGTEAEIKLKAKTSAVPHICGQTRLTNVAPSRPEREERLPLSSPVAPPVDEIPVLDPEPAADDDEDVRPTGEVNPELLAGEAARSIEADLDDDLLPF